MKLLSFKKQIGSIMPMTALALTSIVGMTGLVFDSSHVFVNQARVQSMLDAAALSSAKVLDDTRSQFLASAAAQRSLANNLAQGGSRELRRLGLVANNFTIQYSSTRNPFVAGPAARRFVRIQLNPNIIQVNTLFMQIFGVNSLSLSGSAVAGPSPPLGSVCNLVPTVVCGNPAIPPDDNGRYGYNYGAQVTLAMGNIHNSGEASLGPGNFQLLDLENDGNGNGNSLRANLAGGSTTCASTGDPLPTNPGANRGPVAQGFNTRFGIYNGPVNSSDYPPDFVTDADDEGYPDTYLEYQQDYARRRYDEPVTGYSKRRVVSVAFASCDGTVNGRGNIDVIGFGCVFLTSPAQNNGALRTVQMFGELIRECRSSGVPGTEAGDGTGAHTIQLYGDPDKWAS